MKPVGNVGMFHMNEVVVLSANSFTNQGHKGHAKPLILLNQLGIFEVETFDNKRKYSFDKSSWRRHDKFAEKLLQYLQPRPLETRSHVVKFMVCCEFPDEVVLPCLTAGS